MAMNSLGLGLTVTYKDLASTGIGKTGKSMDTLGKSANKMGSRSGEAFGKFQAGVAKLAVAAVAIKGITAAFKGATEAASAFEKSIAEVATLTDEATIPTEELREISLAMAETFGGAPTAQAEALYNAISAGAGDAAAAQSVLTASNKLAIGGVTDVNTALDGLTSVLNAYGESFENASAASDTFFVAVKAGKTTVAELSAVVGGVAPTANDLGISMDELFASISSVTASGIKTSAAATGLKAAMANIIKPTGDAAKEADRLGIKFDAASLRSKGLNKFLKEITGSAKFNKESFGKLFSSVEGLNTITALTANNSAKFTETLDAMAKKSGATKTAFDKMSETMAFQEDQFAALVDVSKIMIGEALAPLVRKLIEFGRVALEAFNSLPEPMRNMIVKGAALVAVVIALVAAGSALASGIGLLAPALAVIAKPAAILAAVLGPLILTFLALKQSFAENAEQGASFGASMSSIWNTIQNGVSIVGQVFSTFFGGVKAGFQSFVTEAKPTIDAFVAALAELSSALSLEGGDAAAGTLKKAGDAGQTTGKVFGKIAEVVLRVATAAIQVGTGMAEAWTAAGDIMSPIFDAFSDAGTSISEMLSSVGLLNSEVGSGAGAWKAIGGAITTVIGIIASGIGDTITSVASTIRSLIAVVGGVVNIIAGILTGDWGRVWQGVKQVVFGVVTAVMNLVAGMVTGIALAIDAAGKLVGKNLGLAKKVRGLQKDLTGDLKTSLGLDVKIKAPAKIDVKKLTEGVAILPAQAGPAAAPSAAPVAPVASPLAAPGPGGPVIAPGEIKAAAVAAAAAAGRASPPLLAKGTMTVDGTVLGEFTAKFIKDGEGTVPVVPEI